MRLRWPTRSYLSIDVIIVWLAIHFGSLGTPVDMPIMLFPLSLGKKISRGLGLPIVVRVATGNPHHRQGKSPAIQVRHEYKPVARSSAPSNTILTFQVLPAISSTIINTSMGF